ncbi:MAG: ATP-binding protein, partial [Deltaproteobacteria bacterium]
WDRARLGRLVGHVVSNAIRHAGGRIEISVLARDREAELVVRDRGPGLDPAKLSRWFDRAEPLRRPDSFGIGLWIIKTLSEAMRGSVTAANCCDGGARFCIVLPRG